jgi:hypothetical protein
MKNKIFVFLAITLILISCGRSKDKVNLSKIDLNINILRFDKELFALDTVNVSDSISALNARYGQFFEIFNNQIVHLGSSANPAYPDYLNQFLHDNSVFLVNQQVKSVFSDLKPLEKQLTNAFKRFHYYFPNQRIPMVISYVSGVNQSIISADSIIGIGLDKYLGENNDIYKKIGIPVFMTKRMNPNNIPVDCIKGWLLTQYELPDSITEMLGALMYQGKVMYCTQQLLPDVADTLLFNFSADQMKWCKNNEKQMWTYLVEKQFLFITDVFTINKFLGESPFTKDFTQESPGQAVIWLGWRIISKYMDKNPNVTLEQLMQNNNYQEILASSRYNP